MFNEDTLIDSDFMLKVDTSTMANFDDEESGQSDLEVQHGQSVNKAEDDNVKERDERNDDENETRLNTYVSWVAEILTRVSKIRDSFV